MAFCWLAGKKGDVLAMAEPEVVGSVEPMLEADENVLKAACILPAALHCAGEDGWQQPV